MTALSAVAALRQYPQILSVTRHSHPYVAPLSTLFHHSCRLGGGVHVCIYRCVCQRYLMSVCLALQAL